MANVEYRNYNYADRLIQKYQADQFPEYQGKYPRQIINTAYVKNQKTMMFSVEDFLCTPDIGKKAKDCPLGSLSLSRYELVINDGNRVVRANLPADDVHALAERCRAIVHAKMIKNVLGISSKGEAQAEPVKIMMGKFKGKTPEEILLENPNNAQELMNTVNYISRNLENPGNERYREGNIRQINAIRAAIDKLNRGTLQPTAASCICVYDSKVKNRSRKLDNGLYRAYHLTINCHMSGNSPWELTIEECDVPVDIDQNSGKQQIKTSGATNKVSMRVYMGTVWENIIEKMDANLRAFEVSVYAEQKAYVEANSYYFLRRKHPEKYRDAHPEQNRNYGYGQTGYAAQREYGQPGYTTQGYSSSYGGQAPAAMGHPQAGWNAGYPAYGNAAAL